VYPYESRWKWLVSSRYNHILTALRMAPSERRDSLLESRAEAMGRWDRVRATVMVLLYAGVFGTAIGYAGNFVPAIKEALPFLAPIVRILGALTGLLTLLYLLVTRLLSQIEADILMILATIE